MTAPPAPQFGMKREERSYLLDLLPEDGVAMEIYDRLAARNAALEKVAEAAVVFYATHDNPSVAWTDVRNAKNKLGKALAALPAADARGGA